MNNSSICGSWKGYYPPPAAAAASGVDAASEVDGINVLPPEILSQVFTFLGRNDVLSASLVSRSWNAIAIDYVKRREMELLQIYLKFLADNLDGEKYPFEKNELLRLSKDKHILNCDSLGEIKMFLLEVRHNIESQLSKLDQYDFNKLRELTKNEKMPGLFKVIFALFDVVNSLHEANLIQEPLLKTFTLFYICKNLIELGELDKALAVARRRIGARSHYDVILADICSELIDRGHFEKAIEIAGSIQKYCLDWGKVFQIICWSLAQVNKVDRAMEVASNLDTKRLRSYAFKGICMSLYSSNQFDKAIAAFGKIEECDVRGVVLKIISNEKRLA